MAKKCCVIILAIFCAVLSRAQGTPALQVTSPADLTVVVPGQTVTFSVKADPSISGIAIMGRLGYTETLAGPLQFSFTVPADALIDQYVMGAAGLASNGTDVESNTIRLAVERPLPPVSIRASDTVLPFEKLGDMLSLHVTGVFADGSETDLSYSLRTIYSSSNPGVVIVDSRGYATAVGPGDASINIANPGGTIIVPVRVKTPANPAGDMTPPTTTAQFALPQNAQGWNNTSVIVTLTAQDEPGGSGVKLVVARAKGAQTMDFASLSAISTPFITTEGETNVAYFAVDSAGNRENPHLVQVKLDKTPPSITGLPDSGCKLRESNSLFQVATVSASDALSGLAAFSVTVTSNQPMDLSKDLVISGTGLQPRTIQLRPDQEGTTPRTYTFTATASDLAGNGTTASAVCTVSDD